MTNKFGIYVHIPFCIHRCSYCDFFSTTGAPSQIYVDYVKNVENEILSAWRLVSSETQEVSSFKPVTSIFFGGGTPSLLPFELISRILDCIWNSFEISPDVEVTLETNPETVNVEFCSGLIRERRINRISMGAQSFQDKHLDSLERLCKPTTIRHAVRMVKEAGIQNFNLDLIFGIPRQSFEDIQFDIREAAALEPTHISSYALSLKPGHKEYGNLPLEEESAEQYSLVFETLGGSGYAQYEISNYANVGSQCQHNLLYWSGNDFLGVGVSASR